MLKKIHKIYNIARFICFYVQQGFSNTLYEAVSCDAYSLSTGVRNNSISIVKNKTI